MSVVATVTIAFILVGDINFLAPIVTMPFLLTYACIDYSYFALAQTFDIQMKREERYRIQAQSPSYESRRYGSTAEHDNDLDHLFPERTRHKLGNSSTPSAASRRTPSKAQPSASTEAAVLDTTPISNGHEDQTDPNHPDRVVFRDGSAVTTPQSAATAENEDDDEPLTQPIAPIKSKTKNWYSNFCNRWVSLFGAIIKIVIMMLVNSYYGATCIGVVFLVWFYVGTANPAVKPGLAAEFRLFVWLKNLVFRCFG